MLSARSCNLKVSAKINVGSSQRNSIKLNGPRTSAFTSNTIFYRAIRVKTSSSRGDKQSEEPAWYEDRGNGGNNGGNGNGGDDGWGELPEDGGRSGGGYGGNFGVLLAAAAASYGAYNLYQKRKKSGSGILKGLPLPDEYDSDDVRTLKRLLRDVFSDLVKVRTRLDELENATGIASSDLVVDATPLEATSTKSGNNSNTTASPAGSSPNSPSLSRTRSALSGALKIGGGLLWDQEASSSPASASSPLNAPRDGSAGTAGGVGLDTVQDAGVRLGTDLILRVGGPVRGGKDAVMAEVRIDPGEEQFALQKILYSCRVAPGLRAILAPFGARGQDVAYTLNPLAGQGLTSSVKHGNPLHQKVLGSVLAAAADLKKAWLSLAYFSSSGAGGGSDDGEIHNTIMAQAVISPIPAISLGLTILEPGENLLRGGGSSGISGSSSSSSSSPTSSSLGGGVGGIGGVLPPPGQPQRQLGGMVALSIKDLALHGWAAADSDSLETKAWHDIQWGMSVGPRQDGSGNGWSLGVGKIAAAGPGPQSEELLEALQPNLIEISTQWNMGDGMLLTPGVVVLKKGGQNTVFAGIKTAWMF
jgi:hypothetical protein